MSDYREQIAAMLHELDQTSLRAEAERAAADPQAHKLTRVMAPGVDVRYRYFPAGSQRGYPEVRYCWATVRNAAGYYLGWRERATSTRGQHRGDTIRDQWVARKKRKAVKALALRRRDSFRKRQAAYQAEADATRAGQGGGA